jgi:hypothetical protein
MRQGNGSDLLGLKDPRSTKIGIIYVGPNDVRKNVLTAILTQEKLGRTQIAIVLPQNQPNKAFQRPQDFDDLKTVRRKLRAQLIFIAPPGSGPAEFARQRRFSVYSSLESYTDALRAETSSNEARAKRKTGRLFSFGKKTAPLAIAIAGKSAIIDFANKKGRLFSFAAATPTSPMAQDASNHAHSPYVDLPTVDLGQQAPQSEKSGASSLPTSATSTMDTSSLPTDRNSVATTSDAANLVTHDTQQPVSLDVPSASIDEDWDALPPAPLVSSPQTNAPVASLPPDTTPPSALSSTPETPDSTIEAGPSIIELPPSPQASPGRSTAKQPTVGAESTTTSTGQPSTEPLANSRPSQRHHTGKMAAVIGTKAAAPAQQKVGMGHSSVRGNQSTQAENTRKESSSSNLNGIFAIIAILLLIGAGIVSCESGLLNPFASAKTVITITPRSKVEQDSYVIQAITSNADSTKRQISLRQLTFSSPQQSKSVPATGHAQTSAKAATGQLTFYNGSAQDYWIGSDTTIPGPNGVSVVPNEPVDVPASNPPTFGSITVDAHATTSGVNGNMAAGAINKTCCASGDFIKVVSSAFTGGQDGENYTYLQQSDIDNVINQLKPLLPQQARKDFNSQMKPHEQLVGAPQCTTTPKVNQPIGKQGKNVTSANITVSSICTGLAYDASEAQILAQNLLKKKAASSLGQGYVLAGTIVTKQTVTDVQDHVVTLQVTVAGTWYYQFDDSQKQTLAKQLVHASHGTAQKLLNNSKGIANAKIDLANGSDTLPADPNQIRITIAGVSRASSTDLPATESTNP